MIKRVLLFAIVLLASCKDTETLGRGEWKVVRRTPLFADSGTPPWTLYRRVDGKFIEVDRPVIAWRVYGECVAYMTSRVWGGMYVACVERAPAYVGPRWDFGEDAVLNADDTPGSELQPRIELPVSRFHEFTRTRPRLSAGWNERDTDNDRVEMLERVQRMARPRTGTQ